MPHAPRRWFQFHLSTWFVLIVIAAWAMFYWPWMVKVRTNYRKVLPNGVHDTWYIDSSAPDPRLLYPALALAVFVGWKVARAIGWRTTRRRRPAKILSATGTIVRTFDFSRRDPD